MKPRFVGELQYLFYSICLTTVAAAFTGCGTFTYGWVKASNSAFNISVGVPLTYWRGREGHTFSELPSWLKACIFMLLIAFAFQILVLIVWYPLVILLRRKFTIPHRYGIGMLFLAGLFISAVVILWSIKWDSYYPVAEKTLVPLTYKVGYSYILIIAACALTFLNVIGYVFLIKAAHEPI